MTKPTTKRPNEPTDDQITMHLGAELVRMIHELRDRTSGIEPGYSRRCFTYPGGYVELMLISSSDLADVLEQLLGEQFDIQPIEPRPH